MEKKQAKTIAKPDLLIGLMREIMDNYGQSTYGERISPVYDEMYSASDKRSIAARAELAQGGPALELGIGTGRIALPLRQKGVDVHGIDASESMLEKLRASQAGRKSRLAWEILAR